MPRRTSKPDVPTTEQVPRSPGPRPRRGLPIATPAPGGGVIIGGGRRRRRYPGAA